jgi:hypothetical protein
MNEKTKFYKKILLTHKGPFQYPSKSSHKTEKVIRRKTRKKANRYCALCLT